MGRGGGSRARSRSFRDRGGDREQIGGSRHPGRGKKFGERKFTFQFTFHGECGGRSRGRVGSGGRIVSSGLGGGSGRGHDQGGGGAENRCRTGRGGEEIRSGQGCRRDSRRVRIRDVCGRNGQKYRQRCKP